MDTNDELLVRQCQEQLPYETTAFESLLRQYEPIVFHTCARYLRNEQEAEEACQDAFLRVFHGLPKFEGRAKFRTWLFRIVVNVCRRHFAVTQKRLASHTKFLDAAQYELPVGDEPQPQDFDEVTGIIGEGMDLLAPDDRQILILRHVSELSFDELAATLDIGLSAAKMRLYRAEQRLRLVYGQLQAEGNE